jgi:predicted RNA-binding protein with PIN domain
MGGLESFEEGRLNTDQIEVLMSLARSVAEASGAAAALGAHLGVSAELLATLIPEGRVAAEHGDQSPETAGADRGLDLTTTPAGAAGATSPAGASPGGENPVFSAAVPGAGQDLRTHETRRPGNPAEGRGGGVRRVPLRPRRGLVAGTPAAVEDLLSTPGVIVLVDGYNASIAIWPQLALPNQREALLSAMERIHARTGAEIRIIYDGNDRGGPTTVAVPLRVRVEFTPQGEEADDRIIGLAERLPQSRPLVVVSADRRVQAGVRKFGATLLAPAQLREYLNP